MKNLTYLILIIFVFTNIHTGFTQITNQDSLKIPLNSSTEKYDENQFPQYFLSSSAVEGTNSKRFQYRNNLLFINRLNIGITDKLSLNAGVFFLGTDLIKPYWVYPNYVYSFRKSKLSVSIGILGGRIIPGLNTYIINSTITYGDNNRNISLGLGRGMLYENNTNNVPTNSVSLNFLYRVNRRLFLIGESRFINTEFITTDVGDQVQLFNFRFYAFGARSAFKHWAFDYGILFPKDKIDDGIITAIPWIGITVGF